MGTYSGRLWLESHTSDKLNVQILLDEETIRITSNGALIGNWPMSEVEIGHVGQNLHLFVEGEHMVIAPVDPQLVPAVLSPESITEEPQTPQVVPTESNETQPSQKDSSGRGAHKAKRRMRWKW